jgi:rSAM/selenodomain-associated transferase 2
MRGMISVVIPTLNAGKTLPFALAPLVQGVMAEAVKEVIVSDGGSSDDTAAIAEAAGCGLTVGPSGRGVQLMAGAALARAPWMLFLHADTVLQQGWAEEALNFMHKPEAAKRAAAFAFALDDTAPAARRTMFWVGVRCGVLGLPYGDQGLLISRSLYQEVGGFRPIPLMEDVDLIRRLGKGRLTLLKSKAVTSAARFRAQGYARRSLGNLLLLGRFLMGADPHDLARAYDRRS